MSDTVDATVFADVAGFTTLTEAHGDEEAADLVSAFCEAVGEELQTSGGMHVKTIGDALMLAIPDPSRAVQLGLRIANELMLGHAAPEVRVGLHFGSSVIAPIARRLRISDQRLASLERSLARHGGRTVLVGRFMGFVRALAPFMAGASGMRYRDLAPWSLAGSGAWAIAFTLVGYQFADAVESASRRTSLMLLAVAAVVATLLVLRHRHRTRTANPPALHLSA